MKYSDEERRNIKRTCSVPLCDETIQLFPFFVTEMAYRHFPKLNVGPPISLASLPLLAFLFLKYERLSVCTFLFCDPVSAGTGFDQSQRVQLASAANLA